MTIKIKMTTVLKSWGSSKHKDSLVTAGDIYRTVPDDLMPFDDFEEVLEKLVKEGLVDDEQGGYYCLSASGISFLKIRQDVLHEIRARNKK